MGDFFNMLSKKVMLYFTFNRRTTPGSLDLLRENLKRLSIGKIEDYEHKTIGKRRIEVRFRHVEECLNAIEESIVALREESSIFYHNNESISLSIDEWLIDASGRYVDPHNALKTLKVRSGVLYQEYEIVKKSNPAKAEYYRVRIGILADDLNSVIDGLLK